MNVLKRDLNSPLESWTLTLANNMQVSIMQSDSRNMKLLGLIQGLNLGTSSEMSGLVGGANQSIRLVRFNAALDGYPKPY